MKPRTLFQRFMPYVWEPSTEELASSLRLKAENIVRLDTGASPFFPKPLLEELSPKLLEIKVNQYPDTTYHDIRKALSSYCKTGVDNFVITNGADEGLDIIAKAFLDPGDEAIISSPTYSMLKIVTEVHSGKPVMVRRNEGFQDNIQEILRRVGKRTQLIFLCSPNNPTGNPTRKDAVEELAERDQALVVVDEAYFEFFGESVSHLTERYDNVVVVRTLSKAFSLAGVRVGYLMGSKESVEVLNKVRPPNSLSTISLELGKIALGNLDFMRENVQHIRKERDRCMKILKGFRGVEAYSSEANFILFRITHADANFIHRELMERGIVLRNLSSVEGLDNCLRVTISLPEENDIFLSALDEILRRL